MTDQLNHTTAYTYDDADRLTAITDAASHVTQYAYDTEDNLTSITDANNHTTSFAYNPRGWVTQTTFPSSHAETYDYDATGNLTLKTDRKGQTITYVYDALNRLTQKNYPDSTNVEYIYDLVGKVTQVNDPTGTYGFAYDNMGRLIGTTTEYSFVTGHTFSNSYTYDAASNRLGFTAPDGSTNTYSYDSLNRLGNLTNSMTGTFGLSYDPVSRITQMTRPNGVNSNYAYDTVSRVLSILHQFGSTTLDGASYTYDTAGNRTSKVDYLASITSNYSDDVLDQLTQVAQGPNTTESYSYDNVGNRLSSLGSSPYTYNSSNHMTSDPAGSYSYDNNGNMLTEPSGKSYVWDVDNRLLQVNLPSSSGTVTFRYDPFGRRIQKSSASGVTNYLYDVANLVDEVDGGGSVQVRYTQDLGLDQDLAQQRSSSTMYYEQDGVGSVTSSTNSAGGLLNTYAYDSYGKLSSSSGTLTNALRFVGREFDQETGLYFLRARYYNPNIGRFISEDPIGFAGDDQDLFSYVGNNPVRFTDAFGLQRNNSPRLGPPNTDVVIPDPLRPGEGTIRVYGPNGEAVVDYDFGHDHGYGDPHAHDWLPGPNGKPARVPRRLRPNECTGTDDQYWKKFWHAFYVSYSEHMVRVGDSFAQDYDDLKWHLTHPITPNPVTPYPPPVITPPPPYIWIGVAP